MQILGRSVSLTPIPTDIAAPDPQALGKLSGISPALTKDWRERRKVWAQRFTSINPAEKAGIQAWLIASALRAVLPLSEALTGSPLLGGGMANGNFWPEV
jgi:hypothetical protein